MRLPGSASLAFVAFLLILLPLGARRTARALCDDGALSPISREKYWRSAIVVQLLVLAFAWWTGATFGYRIFATGVLDASDALLAGLALVFCLLVRFALQRSRSEAKRRGLSVYRRAPRTTRERAFFVAAVLLAAVAEEAAYRGVGWTILQYSLGDLWSSALILSAAFALAHWSQGWKSLAAIFVLALLFHGLVALTATLVIAMAVHAAYDLIAGLLIQRRALEYDAMQATAA